MNDSTTHPQEGAFDSQKFDGQKFDAQKTAAAEWFASLRDSICATFETIEEWVPPPPEEAWESEREREVEEAEMDDD